MNCPDCGEPLSEAEYVYPFRGQVYHSWWCRVCEDWKPDPLLPATRRNPPVGEYREHETLPVEEMVEG